MRRRPAADVSPLTPAFTTRNGNFAESISCWISAGYDSSGSSPRPAVRLVPKKSTTGRESDNESTRPTAPFLARPSRPHPSAPHTRSPRSPPSPRPQPPGPSNFRTMIIAEALEQTYLSGGRPLTVLRDINLAILAREVVAITGPSGSGKTTLLGLLAGLDRPTKGIVRLDGEDIGPLSEDSRARLRAEKVGFVFQTFQLLPTLTALENVLVPMELQGRNGKVDRGRQLLEKVGLGDRSHHYPAQLSGGEQQRVAIARAFANQPKILFADEPTGSLDAENGRTIIDLLVDLNRDAGTTLLLVTHDPALAERANRTIRLAGGAIV